LAAGGLDISVKPWPQAVQYSRSVGFSAVRGRT
jgi:hypothetical protein